jgi:uncharacterized membrane protein (DUF373 family)
MAGPTPDRSPVLKAVGRVETAVEYTLLVLLLLSVVLGTLQLARVLVTHILFEPPYFLFDVERLAESFGLFLIVLIGLELMKSLKSMIVHEELRPEIVVEVAIIAVGNKLITLDLKHTEAPALLGLAAVLVGLAATYFVVKRARGA